MFVNFIFKQSLKVCSETFLDIWCRYLGHMQERRVLERMEMIERREKEDLRNEVYVLCITNGLRKVRPRWFGHVVCREEHNAIKKGGGCQWMETQQGTAKVKNERRGEERHRGGRGCGGDGKG